MKAYVYRRYGGPDVVELADVPDPVPKDDEVLVKVLATTVTAADWRVRTLSMPKGFGPVARLAIGVTRPRQPIMGTELAGVVEAVGSRVTRFKPGDAVVAFPGGKMGCHAQFRTVAEDGPIAPKPERLTFEEAASLSFGGTTALHFLRKAALAPGERVLVVGASGNVGTAIVQLAKHEGARVTGVTSTRNLDLVRSLGADDVVDYRKEDWLARENAFDVVADTVGEVPFSRSKRVLAGNGRHLAVAGGLSDTLASARKREGGKRVIAGPAPERAEDVREVMALAERGVLRPVIDRVYAWEEMREAHAHVESRRKRGSVVVRVRHDA